MVGVVVDAVVLCFSGFCQIKPNASTRELRLCVRTHVATKKSHSGSVAEHDCDCLYQQRQNPCHHLDSQGKSNEWRV